jgi:hypothetical protein
VAATNSGVLMGCSAAPTPMATWGRSPGSPVAATA